VEHAVFAQRPQLRPALEHVERSTPEVDRAPLPVLRLVQDEALACEFDVSPAEPEDLASSHPRRDRRHDDRL